MQFCTAVLCTIALAAVSTLFFSCAKDELDYGRLSLIGEPKPITASAFLPKSASLDKTTVGTDGKVRWELTDEIMVNNSVLPIERLLSDTLALFSGSAGGITVQDGSAYWATYPATLPVSSYTSATLSVTLPATQTCNGTSIPNYMAAYATAEGENLRLQFKNLCAIVRIPVVAASATGNAAILSRIEITSIAQNKCIAGPATVNLNGGNPTLSCSNASDNLLTLNCGNTDVSSQKTFSIVLPANNSCSFVVRFYDADGNYMQKKLKNINLARNTMYTTAAVALDANIPAGALPYKFSLSGTSKVYMSSGNLQWSATGGGTTSTTHAVAGGGTAAGTWRFAEHQYDFIGSANSNISSSYTGWIDLFGWATSGYNNRYPYMTSTTRNDYRIGTSTFNDMTGTTNSNYDWGVYNAISNGGNQPGLWRTLTRDEWGQITTGTYGKATVNSVKGVVVLPSENWEYPGGLTLNTSHNNYTNNSYTAAQWQQMDACGAAFLPAAGYRLGTTVTLNESADTTSYWSSTHRNVWDGKANAHVLLVTKSNLWLSGTSTYASHPTSRCHYGNPVRLVRNAN